jgi:hypothetical protein
MTKKIKQIYKGVQLLEKSAKEALKQRKELRMPQEVISYWEGRIDSYRTIKKLIKAHLSK